MTQILKRRFGYLLQNSHTQTNGNTWLICFRVVLQPDKRYKPSFRISFRLSRSVPSLIDSKYLTKSCYTKISARNDRSAKISFPKGVYIRLYSVLKMLAQHFKLGIYIIPRRLSSALVTITALALRKN